MSFGFSPSDLFVVCHLIKEIVASLKETAGAKSDYQELVRELEGLQRTLSHLDDLQASSTRSATLESIEYATLSCRKPLEDFLEKTKRYDSSLGANSKKPAARAAADKLRWAFGHREERRKLQNYLSIHIGTINMLLTEHTLGTLALTSRNMSADNQRVQETLDSTRNTVESVRDSVISQSAMIERSQSMLSSLFAGVTRDFQRALGLLVEMLSKIHATTQQIYNLLLEMRQSLPTVDTRWTYFQAPLVVEDAFGFKFPVPSEYDYGMLKQIIHYKFRSRRGLVDVVNENYELFHTKRSKEVISPSMCLIPGTEITMGFIVVGNPIAGERVCPLSNCRSQTILPCPGGRWECSHCRVRFDFTTRKRRAGLSFHTNALDFVQDTLFSESLELTGIERSQMWQVLSATAGSNLPYRNVRVLLKEDTKLTGGLKEVATMSQGPRRRGWNKSTPQANDRSNAGDDKYQAAAKYIAKAMNDKGLLESYRHSVTRYQKGLLSIDDYISSVAGHFAGQLELIAQFGVFFPDGYWLEYDSGRRLWCGTPNSILDLGIFEEEPVFFENTYRGPCRKRKIKDA